MPVYHKHKIFYRSDVGISGVPWAWPFVDVKFYKRNASWVWNYDYHNVIAARRSDIYPLVRRPFASMWLPTPRDTQQFLIAKFVNFSLTPSSWDHVSDTRKSQDQRNSGTDCLNIADSYPYVVRMKHPTKADMVLETLWMSNGKHQYYTLELNQSYQVKNPEMLSYNMSIPFTLT